MSDIPLISVVDDDAWAREGIKQLVLSLGFQALDFSSVDEFFESGCIDKTTCVVADVQMPNLSGLDLQDLLRERGYKTPIIFVTAYPDERYRARAFAGGATCFLCKPFNEQSFIDCLTSAVAQRERGAKVP